MKKYIILKFSGILIGMLFCSACNSWLQVKMEDKILENKLYENLEGYMSALNGIYAGLNIDQLYGRNLSVGAIDVMAQYYDVLTPKDHLMKTFGDYDFAQAAYKSLFSSVWTEMYSLLANVNLLIENCERMDAPLPGIMKGVITGEAYALRAMLHFDLLRLYGPVYRENTKSVKVMPYMDAADREIRPLLSAEEVLNRVIEDFEKAAALLVNDDPVVKEGPKNGSSPEDVNNDLNYRQYRLNYYAVKALLARAHLWGGDKEMAVAAAKEVIAVCKGETAWFPFTDKAEVLRAEDPDRIFSSEVLFGLYNTSRTSMFEYFFQKTAGTTNLLTLYGTYTDGRLRMMFPEEGDIRFALWASETLDSTEVLYHTKYEGVKDPRNQNMIPLVRTSEMYLLLAECCDSDIDSRDYINELRYARGARNIILTTETRDRLIAEEFAREMIGEGQLYLFYKRRGMVAIPSGKSKDQSIDMAWDNYVWLLPDKELENRYDN